MYTQAEIATAIDEVLGDASSLATTDEKTRWFNDGQARIGWYGIGSFDLTWAAGDRTIALDPSVYQVEEFLYPDSEDERRWEARTGTLTISDHEGADEAGGCAILARVYWPDVDGSTPSSLPRTGDAACVSYALHRFFRKLVSNRALFQRYATLIGSNGVRIEDLAQTADDHYSDYLDLRAELPDSPPVAFFHG